MGFCDSDYGEKEQTNATPEQERAPSMGGEGLNPDRPRPLWKGRG